MRVISLLILASATLSAQWTALPNSTFNASVCPANGTSGSTCPSGSGDNVCSGDSTPYRYQACYTQAIISYSGGMARTKPGSEQLIVFGGGHGDYGGNEVYAINVGNASGVSRLTAPSHIDSNDYWGIGQHMVSSGNALTVNTNGATVTWVAGSVNFTTACVLGATNCWVGHEVVINGTSSHIVKSVESSTSLTLFDSAGTNTGTTLEVTSGDFGFTTRDGNPPSSHSYTNLAYIDPSDPTYPDSMFFFGGAVYGGGRHSDVGWIFSFATNTWKMILPNRSGFIPDGPQYGGAAVTFYDSVAHLIWLIDGGNVVSLDPSTCTGTGPVTCTYQFHSASATALGTPGAAFDTNRHRIVAMGGAPGASGSAYLVNLTSPYGTTDITSSIDSSCSSVLNAVGPGMVYIPSLDQIVAYPSDSGGTAYFMNPSTFTCTAVAYSGGPANGGVTEGLYGRLQYFPTLGEIVTLNAPGQAAFVLPVPGSQVATGGSSGTTSSGGSSGTGTTSSGGSSGTTSNGGSSGTTSSGGSSGTTSSGGSSSNPPATPTGLGHSTYNCVDIDGDGYGTGPGCLGPDADDLDAAVHTGDQAIAKWGSLKGFITQRLQYTANNFWYVSPGGNDSNTCHDTDGATNIGQPCQTINHILTSGLTAGDILIFRGGTYTEVWDLIGGAANQPIVYMAYPGEKPLMVPTTRGSSVNAISWFVIDGLAFQGPGSEGNALSGYLVTNATFRHLDLFGWLYSLAIMNGTQSVTIEESAFHDNWEHGVYLGARGIPNSNITFQRNLVFFNGWTGFQHNGRVTNLVVQNNWIHSNDLSPLSFENGVSHSYVLSNLLVNNGRSSITFGGSDPGAGLDCSETSTQDLICPHNENYNVIENNTMYNTGCLRNGDCVDADFGVIQVAGKITDYPDKDYGHNIYRNNIMYAGNYAAADTVHTPLRQDCATSDCTVEASWWTTTIFDHNVISGLFTSYVFDLNQGANLYDCAGMATTFGSGIFPNGVATDCKNVNPQFVDVSTSYYNQPGKFNFNLAAGSPAIHAGSPTGVPSADVIGNAFASPPSLGALESSAASGTVSAGPCDLNSDGVVNNVDVQLAISQSLGISACGNASLEGNGLCTVTDVQRVINASLGGACKTGQ